MYSFTFTGIVFKSLHKITTLKSDYLPLLAVYPGGLKQRHKRPSTVMRRMLLAARYTSGRAALAVRNPRFTAHAAIEKQHSSALPTAIQTLTTCLLCGLAPALK
jgi:hypothetical protein